MKKTELLLLSLLMVVSIFSVSAGYPYRNCKEYIKSGEWIERFGEITLSVVPTDCGRSIYPRETDKAFSELVAKFGHDKYWYNTLGMRNQFSCHLAIARNKPEWNLEPYRKYVGYEATKKADCNPY